LTDGGDADGIGADGTEWLQEGLRVLDCTITINDVKYSDPAEITDPKLRKLVEDAMAAGATAQRKFVINGVTYSDRSQIDDAKLRKLVEDTTKLGPDAVK
jgi:ribosomal protein L20A (L18A)